MESVAARVLCPHCREPVRPDATACPHCGRGTRRQEPLSWPLAGLALLFPPVGIVTALAFAVQPTRRRAALWLCLLSLGSALVLGWLRMG